MGVKSVWRVGVTLRMRSLTTMSYLARCPQQSGLPLKVCFFHGHLSPGVDTVSTARSWSYDNMTTYPVMPMPPRKEIRYERRVIDGVTTVVETEVEVQPQMKRLFLFPGKERR